LDAALDAAFQVENGDTDWGKHSPVIWQWTDCSKEFFEHPPHDIDHRTMPFYVRVHNALLHVALAAGNAEEFRWEPTG